jgi:hypothetical protein
VKLTSAIAKRKQEDTMTSGSRTKKTKMTSTLHGNGNHLADVQNVSSVASRFMTNPPQFNRFLNDMTAWKQKRD